MISTIRTSLAVALCRSRILAIVGCSDTGGAGAWLRDRRGISAMYFRNCGFFSTGIVMVSVIVQERSHRTTRCPHQVHGVPNYCHVSTSQSLTRYCVFMSMLLRSGAYQPDGCLWCIFQVSCSTSAEPGLT